MMLWIRVNEAIDYAGQLIAQTIVLNASVDVGEDLGFEYQSETIVGIDEDCIQPRFPFNLAFIRECLLKLWYEVALIQEVV